MGSSRRRFRGAGRTFQLRINSVPESQHCSNWGAYCTYQSMETKEDEYMKPLVQLLKSGGFWFDFSGHKHAMALKWCNIARNVIAFSVWAYQMAYFMGGVSYLLTEAGVFVPICFDEGAVAVIVLCNQSTIRETIRIYRKRFEVFGSTPWAKNIIDSEMNKFNRIFQLPKLMLSVFFLFYSVVPLVYDAVLAYSGKSPYVVPLPLNFLLETPTQRTPAFYMTIYLSYLYFMIIVPRFIAFEALMMYIVAFVVIDVKILVQKMKNLSEKDDGSLFLQEEWNLKDVIDHHSTVVRVVEEHFWLVGLAMMVQNLTFSISSCLVIYLTKTSFNNGDIVLALFCGNFVVLLMILNLMFNGAGVLIENQGEMVLTAIYDTEWYKQPPKVRKEINAMLRQGLHVLKISYWSNTVNFETAMVVLNRAYSFFTLINTGE
uniref:Odorant receptor n=1 Tax=Apolygus lucorum TaxID=248454 RepID=A0A4P8PBV6_APOLU|nr:olfactory receptor protein 99 [Apolygus lucorum]